MVKNTYSGIWVSQYTSCPGSSSNVTLASSESNWNTINTQWYSNYNLKHIGSLTERKALTHFISISVKRWPVMNMRRGMVRMRMKGRARDAGLDLTTHKTTRQATWMPVYKCIRPVFTCTDTQETHAVICTFSWDKFLPVMLLVVPSGTTTYLVHLYYL